MIKALTLLSPELLVAAAAIACLLLPRLGLVRASRLPVAVGVFVLAALIIELVQGGQLTTLLDGGFSQDRFALFAKAALSLTALIVVLAAGSRIASAS